MSPEIPSNVLAQIIANKHHELRVQRPRDFTRPAQYGSVRDFTAAVSQSGTRFIFECKRKSPSQGALRGGEIGDFIPAYEGIADAISVLTDKKYFGGEIGDLKTARQLTESPLLRKDFTVDPVQVFEAYAAGADAVLLMLSVLDDAGYRECARAAAQCGLHTLTEVHDEAEMQRAIALEAPLIGVNNRDLRSLKIDLATTERLLQSRRLSVPVISESGIRHHSDVRRLAPLVNGFLVGSSLMQAPVLSLAARELAFGPVKICGLTRAQDVAAAYAAGASYGGLIFSTRSPRAVTLAQAKCLVTAAPLNFVGVFTDHDVGEIVAIAEALSLSAVQLHGDYSASDSASLRTALSADVEIWSVHRVAERRDIDALRASPISANRVLLDYKGEQRGGNGLAFDWQWLSSLDDKNNLILAGGIGPSNVAKAIASGVAMIDVNSGVEEQPGVKSAVKLQQLFSQLRQTLATGIYHD